MASSPGRRSLASFRRPQMIVFAIRVENSLDLSIKRSQHADPRKYRRTARRRDQDQSFHRSLPFLGFVLGLRKLRDVAAGVLQRDELVTAGQGVLDRQIVASNPLRISSVRPAGRN
jgi:hypothetical protein